MTGAVVGSASALALTNAFILPIVGTWRNVFTVYGTIGFIIAVCWILLARESSMRSVRGGMQFSLKNMLQSLLSSKYVWMVAIIGSSSFFVFYGFGNWLPTLLEAKGMSPADAGIFASIPTWLGLAGSAIIPGIAKAGSRKPIFVTLLLIEGVFIYVIGITSGTLLAASIIIYGVVSGAVMPLMLVVLMDLPDVGAEYTGMASGLFFSIGLSMGFIGPIVVGYLTDLTSSFLPSLILLAIVVEAMIVIAVFLKET